MTRNLQEARLTLHVPNMRCQNCVASIQEATGKLKGVEAVIGDLERRVVTITYREGKIDPDKFRKAILKRGFLVA